MATILRLPTAHRPTASRPRPFIVQRHKRPKQPIARLSRISHCDAAKLLDAAPLALNSLANLITIHPPPDKGIHSTDTQSMFDERMSALCAIADAAYAALTPGGTAMVIGEGDVLSSWHAAAYWSGFSYLGEHAVVWDKPLTNRPHAASNLPSMFMSVRRYVKPGHTATSNAIDSKPRANVLICEPVPEIHRHGTNAACQLPVELCNYLISEFTSPGDLVIDPMCGTGSMLVSAEMCGRRWCGGDSSLAQCHIARERVASHDVEYMGPIYKWPPDKNHNLVKIEG